LYQVRANKEIYTYKEVARKEGRKERWLCSRRTFLSASRESGGK
jgi:hypothetical protein